MPKYPPLKHNIRVCWWQVLPFADTSKPKTQYCSQARAYQTKEPEVVWIVWSGGAYTHPQPRQITPESKPEPSELSEAATVSEQQRERQRARPLPLSRKTDASFTFNSTFAFTLS